MGAIRKTMSVATIGLVPFRSKKEKLQRAEKASELAELELRKEQEARAEADRRVALADERVRAAESVLVREAKSLRSRRRRARTEREATEAGSRVSASVEGWVDRAAGSVAATAGSAKKETKRAAKHAKQDAKRAAKHATGETKRVTKPLRKKAKSLSRSIRRRSKDGATKASATLDSAVDRAENLVDS